MRQPPCHRSVPLPGLSGFVVDTRGRVHRRASERAAGLSLVTPLTLNEVQHDWQRHADPHGALTRASKDGERSVLLTLASFRPNVDRASEPRRIEVASRTVVVNRMPPMTEQRPFPLPSGVDPNHGWYKLPGFGWVPKDLAGTTLLHQADGVWYFHGPSISKYVFDRLTA